MTDENEPTFSVLYNDSRIFQMSEEATQRYNYKMGEREYWYEAKSADILSEEVCRHDPLLIQIYHELKENFDFANEENDTKIQYTKVKQIPQKYNQYYSIRKYGDGSESVVIDSSQYRTDQIMKNARIILHQDICNDHKVAELKILFC